MIVKLTTKDFSKYISMNNLMYNDEIQGMADYRTLYENEKYLFLFYDNYVSCEYPEVHTYLMSYSKKDISKKSGLLKILKIKLINCYYLIKNFNLKLNKEYKFYK
jgi:hypothetical protein